MISKVLRTAAWCCVFLVLQASGIGAQEGLRPLLLEALDDLACTEGSPVVACVGAFTYADQEMGSSFSRL